MFVLIAAVVAACGCSNAKDNYLMGLEPQLQGLANVWASLNQFPTSAECDELQARLDQIDKKLQELKGPPSCQVLHDLALESLTLQREELVTKRALASLEEAQEINTEAGRKELAALAAQSKATAKKMFELSRKLQGQLNDL